MADRVADKKKVKTSPGDLKSRIFQLQLGSKEIIFLPGFEEEAGYAPLPLRPALEPKEALWIMRTDWEKNKIFDQNYLKAFVKFLAEDLRDKKAEAGKILTCS